MTSAPDATRPPALRPRALVPGSRVALVAPAGPVDAKRIEAACERCRVEGLVPLVFPAAGASHRFMAGTDAERLGDLQVAFDDPSVDAVWALRGGYGTLRLLEDLDLRRQLQDPIPFIGFSDNTSIHVRHWELGVVSFHGPHPGKGFPLHTEEAFRRVLFSDAAPVGYEARERDPQPRALVGGCATGPLVGGNLAILASMCGTRHQLDARGCILFLEDLGEPAYRWDRMLLQLRRSGVTEGIVGLALGAFNDQPDADEYPVADILVEFAGLLGVPTVMNLPFGHLEHNVTLPVGVPALLNADEASLATTEAAVRI